MSSLSSVKITVLDSATLFEGIDTIYRYDLPGTGVEEGWAVNAVIDQIRDMYGAVCTDACARYGQTDPDRKSVV